MALLTPIPAVDETDPLYSLLLRLRTTVKGTLFSPADHGFDAVNRALSREAVRRPALIVRPADAEDVAHVVTLARETGRELAVRSGGHSLLAHSTTDDGIVIDLTSMKGLAIDVAGRTAWAETGLTAGEYSLAAARHGLATGFGDTASVGLGGLTTGGGIGFLVRKYGLTIDNVLAATVVTADGQIRHVDDVTHPDLFWAIRGGGSNFGVVTRFKYRLVPVDTVVGGMLILPPTAAVLAGFAAAAAAAPEELSTIVYVMPAPPLPFIPSAYHGQVVTVAMMVYAGDIDEGQRVLAPFRALAEPIVDELRSMPYPDIYWPDDPEFRPVTALRSKFIDVIDEQTAQIMLDQLTRSEAMIRIAEFRILGGAMARVPAGATAFAHRDRGVMLSFIAQHMDPTEAPIHRAWVDSAAAAVHQGDGSVYVNFASDHGQAGVNAAYPAATRTRLTAIKERYDPDNLFRLNHNVGRNR